MSTITAAEASLINDTEFLEELERCEHVPVSGLAPLTTCADAFDVFDVLEIGLPMSAATSRRDALESGLPTDGCAREAAAPHHERAPIDEPFETPTREPAPAEKPIPFLTAALVLAACLTVGAATAALVFHDRLTQISARSATR